jgi:putative ABC transport system permease protein
VPEEPPAEGDVVADSSLQADGVEEGDTLLLGPARTEVQVVAFVDDTRYSGQASLWGSLETWRAVTAENRPDLATDDSVQALVVRADGSNPAEVADAIDDATGSTATLTVDEAIEALPGVTQQRATFNQIIGVTAIVAVVVVALFFALITVERVGLYGILKAIGASGRTLVLGVVLQAVVVTRLAALVGVVGSPALDAAIPAGALPFVATPVRLASSTALMLFAGVVGTSFSLRRVLRIDPAAAIGASS